MLSSHWLLLFLYVQPIVCDFYEDFSDPVAFQERWQISTGFKLEDSQYNVTWIDRNVNVSPSNLSLSVLTIASKYYGGEIVSKEKYKFGLFEVSAKFSAPPGTANTIIGLTYDPMYYGIQLRVTSNDFTFIIQFPSASTSYSTSFPPGDYTNQFHTYRAFINQNYTLEISIDDYSINNIDLISEVNADILGLSNLTFYIQNYVCIQNSSCSYDYDGTAGVNEIQWIRIVNSDFPSESPTFQPINPTTLSSLPTIPPSSLPTPQPINPTTLSSLPTISPSSLPTPQPSDPPTISLDSPTSLPSDSPTLLPSDSPTFTPTFSIELLEKNIIGSDILLSGNFSFQNVTLQFNTSGSLTIQGCVDLSGGILVLHVHEKDFTDEQLSISAISADCFIGNFFDDVMVNGLEMCSDFDTEQVRRRNLLVVLVSIRNVCSGLSTSTIIIIVVCSVVVPALIVALILFLMYRKQIWKPNQGKIMLAK